MAHFERPAAKAAKAAPTCVRGHGHYLSFVRPGDARRQSRAFLNLPSEFDAFYQARTALCLCGGELMVPLPSFEFAVEIAFDRAAAVVNQLWSLDLTS